MPSALQETFRSAFGPVCEAFGTTEIAPAAWNRPGQIKVGSIGYPPAGSDLRLVDSDGHDVTAGEAGEICIKGPHLMAGYWQDPKSDIRCYSECLVPHG